jgi:DNA-binding LacI/PurR family transcriptional regulator
MGRRRVAVLSCDWTSNLPKKLSDEAERVGLSCWPGHVQSIPSAWARTAPQLLTLMLRGSGKGDAQSPDALIISDDNLVEHATAGLHSMGLRCPEDLAIIALSNLPITPPASVPCTFLGFDSRSLIGACFDSLDRQRRGETPPQVTLLSPVFVA